MSAAATTLHVPVLPMLVLPTDMTFRFIAEPTITFRSCSSSSSSDDAYEDDDGGFHAPFTTSPLDECRGATTKTAETNRGVLLHATSSFAYTKKAARRRKNAKAATMRASR
jgi:hypothetical protein